MPDLSLLEMGAHFSQGLLAVFGLKTFLALCLGVFLGFWVGILPGVGGPTTLALLIPFSFTMEPFSAFALLLGMISVATTAGDITAILFGVPGESTNAATMIDGLPMAKNGEAGRALGASLVSSMLGAIIGAFFLAAAMIIVRPLVLSVGYAEFFMLSLAGIAFLAALTSDAVVKGLAAGALGLLISTVGISAVTGIERFTFGSLFLWDGIGFIPAILGLFAIPELIEMSTARSRLPSGAASRIGNAIEGARDALRHIGLVFRCSALSVYVGLIPGMGASISQWLAYAHASQSAKDPKKMGHGAVEGVIGPGAACTATMSGGLIPTIGFGVPGTPQMAILLGAFLIQGLTPGPDMLTPEANGGHLTLTFSMVWMIIVANIIVVTFSFAFLNHIAKVAYVDESILIPIILALIFIGGFADKNSLNDLWVCLAFGFIGWVMVKLDWPRPPLILGLVLGALVENNFYLTVQAYGFSWLTFPSVMGIFIAIMATILWPFIKAFWRSRSSAGSSPKSDVAPAQPALGPGRRIGDIVVSLALIALFGFVISTSLQWPTSTSLMPIVIGVGGMAFAGLQLGIAALPLARGATRMTLRFGPPEDLGAATRIGVAFLSLFLLVVLCGFTFGSSIFVFAYLLIFSRLTIGGAGLIAGLGAAAVYFIFERLLVLPLPEGLLMKTFSSVLPWGGL